MIRSWLRRSMIAFCLLGMAWAIWLLAQITWALYLGPWWHSLPIAMQGYFGGVGLLMLVSGIIGLMTGDEPPDWSGY